ncbi:MAG TPA: phosphoserine phosphatase SerB [Nitrospinaceae bacterium]|jgi:phosphoserine phosphatase|nr:phosphoserine phosphatase SerB [Nitrospinaceae bacterium]|tara:strand:+ start:490 stop:1734 length:1245 start_codon:yes stop_codon:yes gene_type:complete
MSEEDFCQLHIHISSVDRPGILAEALESVVQFNLDVCDIKQFVFNGLLNLSLLLGAKKTDSIAELKMALDDWAGENGITVQVLPWEIGRRPEAPYKHRSVVTLLGPNLSSKVFLDLTQTFARRDINILRIEQLDYSDHHVIEVVIGSREEHSTVDILNALVQFKESFPVDIAVQEDTLFRRNKRLIVFDADMTFLQCEVIDELGKMAGVGDRMEAITRSAMNGELDFNLALRERVRLLAGLSIDKLEEIYDRIPITPGAEDLVRILQYLGYRIGIVSGGFQFFIDRIKDKYQLDYGIANHLAIEDGKLTGEIEGEVIDARAKEQALMSLARQEGFTLNQVVAVGDGANDIHMLARAGLGIAFNAKPIVQQHANAGISVSNLELILYFLGISGKELKELRKVSQTTPGPSWSNFS